MKRKVLFTILSIIISAVCIKAQTAETFPIDTITTVTETEAETDSLDLEATAITQMEDLLLEMELDSLINMKVDSIIEHILEAALNGNLNTDSIPQLCWPHTLKLMLDNVVKNTSLLRTSTCGIMVHDLTTDSLIYQYNERQRMRPASTMKVFTSVTALDRLGQDHQFRTKMAYSGNIENHQWLTITQPAQVISDSLNIPKPDTIVHTAKVICGDIHVKGGMDPMFSTADLSKFTNAISELGIDTIYGNLVLDLSLKDTVSLGEGWCWDDDNPSLTPLLVDKKPQFASLFLKALNKRGIVLTGSVQKGNFKETATPIAETFHTLWEILKRTLKNSDNTYAECIFYKIGAETSNTKGVSAKTARSAINKMIRQIGKRPEDYYIADGSGLSLYNYLAPDVEVDVLRYAYFRPDIFEILYSRMPIAGVDGTLGKRMAGTKAFNNVHAKTGTLTGVSTLAGYCQAPNGHWLCFSIMNNGIKSSSQGRAFQDRICAILCSTE